MTLAAAPPPSEAPNDGAPYPEALSQRPLYQLYPGDCFDLLRMLPDGCIQMVLTDPPYNTTNLPFDKIRIDWAAWWEEIHRVTEPTAVIAVFAAQPFTTDLINSNRKSFRYDLAWVKNYSVGFLSAGSRPLRAHESVLIFCRRFGHSSANVGVPGVARSVYNPQFTPGAAYTMKGGTRKAAHYSGAGRDLGSRRNTGWRYPTSVLTHGRDRPSHHPTAKPVEMGRWLVRTYSHPGQTVLDTFAGGGSCPISAVLEGRHAIASELDPVHVQTNRRRMSELGLSDSLVVL